MRTHLAVACLLVVTACGEGAAPGPAADAAVAEPEQAPSREEPAPPHEWDPPPELRSGVTFVRTLAGNDADATLALLDPDVRDAVGEEGITAFARAVASRFGRPVGDRVFTTSSSRSGGPEDYALASTTFDFVYERGRLDVAVDFVQAPGPRFLVTRVSIGGLRLATEPVRVFRGPTLGPDACATHFLRELVGGDVARAHELLEPGLAADVSVTDLRQFQERFRAVHGEPPADHATLSVGNRPTGSRTASSLTQRFLLAMANGDVEGTLDLAEHEPGAWMVTGMTVRGIVPFPTEPGHRTASLLDDLLDGRIDEAMAHVDPLLTEVLTRERLEQISWELRDLGPRDAAKITYRGGGAMKTGGRRVWSSARYRVELPGGVRWIEIGVGLRGHAKWRVRSIEMTSTESH